MPVQAIPRCRLQGQDLPQLHEQSGGESDGGEAKLTPLDIKSWETRQRVLSRLNIMRSALIEAKKVIIIEN